MDVFTALADPTRRRILKMVARKQMAASDIYDHFEEMSMSAVSQHLKALREANLVSVQRDGQRRLYTFSKSGLKTLNFFINELK